MMETKITKEFNSKFLLKQKYNELYGKEPEIWVDEHGDVQYRTRDVTELSVNVSERAVGSTKTEALKNERSDYVGRDSLNPNIELITKPLGELVHSCRIAFVRGITGIGKTVLAKRLVIGWANGGIFKKIIHCYFLEGKQLNRFKEVEDLKRYLDEEYCPCETVGGGGVLFIIDAIDEIVDLDRKSSIIHKLLDESNDFFKNSKFIITGRPYVERCFKEGIRSLELNNLPEDDIEKYITLYTNEDKKIADTIYAAKNSSPAVASLLGIPRFLNAFCSIAVLTSGRAILNITEFYCWLLFLFLKQHGKQGLDDSEIFAYHSKVLRVLAKISYDLLREEKVAAHEEEFKSELEEVTIEHHPIFDAFFIELNEAKEKRYHMKQKHLQSFLAALYCFIRQINIKDLFVAEFYEIVAFVCGFNGRYLQSDGNDNHDDVCKLLIEGIQGDKYHKAKDNSGLFMLKVLDNLSSLVQKHNLKSSKLCVEISLLCVNEYLKHMEKYKNQIMFNNVVSKLISVIISTDLSNLYKSWMTQVNLLRLLQIGEINQKLDLFNGMKLQIIPLKCFQLANFFKNVNEVDVHIYSEATASKMQMFIDNFPYCDSVNIGCKGFDCSQAAEKLKNSKEVKLKRISLRSPAASNDDDMTETWKKAIGLIVLVELVELHSWKIGKSEWDTLADEVRSAKKTGNLKLKDLHFTWCSFDVYLFAMFQRVERLGLIALIRGSSSNYSGNSNKDIPYGIDAEIHDIQSLVEWYDFARKEEITIKARISEREMKMLIEKLPDFKSLGIYNTKFDYKQAAAKLRETNNFKLEHVTSTSTLNKGTQWNKESWNEGIELFPLVKTAEFYMLIIGEKEWLNFVEIIHSMKERHEELKITQMYFCNCFMDDKMISMFQRAETLGLIHGLRVSKRGTKSISKSEFPYEIDAQIRDVCKLVEWCASKTGTCKEDVEGYHFAFNPWPVKMTIGKEGGVIESQILDAYVEIPKNALETDVEVEVRRAEPQTVPPFYCTLGEVIEGDYFEVRPIGLEFEKPAILTLPQSYAQIPNLCHVCVKRYDKDKKEWVDAPLCPAEESNKHASVYIKSYIKQTSLYFVCCQLDVETWLIPRTGALITPFGRKYGIKVEFEEDTFVNDLVKVDVKVNTFLESQVTRFNSLGLRPSMFLHIAASNGEQPQKRVLITLPLQGKALVSGLLFILYGDGDGYKDITSTNIPEVTSNAIKFTANHFSIFGIFQTLSTPLLSVIRFLQMLTGPLFQVRISVYCKDGLYTVSCCQRHKWDESIKTMNSCNFHLISFGNAEIECGTKLSVKIHGGYEIKGDPGDLIFVRHQIAETNTFKLKNVENDEQDNFLVVSQKEPEIELSRLYLTSSEPAVRMPPDSSRSCEGATGISEEPRQINLYGGNLFLGDIRMAPAGIQNVEEAAVGRRPSTLRGVEGGTVEEIGEASARDVDDD